MSDIILRAEGVCRDFQAGRETVHALSNVTIEAPRAQLTILRGRSGSGKTTLMNIAGALDRPTRGAVYLMEQEITRLSEARRDNLRRLRIGFVFQSVALISQMTAFENVEFALRLAKTPAKKRRLRVEECLTSVGLAKRMHHRPQELSGGEQQRVAIARAIAHSPDVLFADEPTAELDTMMGLTVVKLLRDLAARHGVTVVMTTHDPGMMELADRVYTLQDGALVDTRLADASESGVPE